MVKSRDEVISEFNEYVNMTADELESWLKSDESESAGWPKEGGDGETIGHESGKRIVEILRENPDKDASKYTDEQVDHMRRVVSYCARHLAQEEKMKETKSEEELEKTKSTKSLKNWGHDPIKAMHQTSSESAKQNAEENTDKPPAPASNGKGKGKGKSSAPEPEDDEVSKVNDNKDDSEGDMEAYNRIANRPKRKRAGKVTEEDLKKLEEEGDDYISEEDEDFEPVDDDDDEAGAGDDSEEEEEDSEGEDEEEPSKKKSRQ
ncbi:hypothetical protein QFC21_004515 [Naganishia friedmannii]|uniref:Uncharacterized protein n=1 Tax=Naganishia friedmannii TaxID=89922 RepID=A0ACC2VHU7_9TREE|nr:hypothetical protein QFC21_004515 [Naganishia friedmannii]